jgi:signal transduction histidine kinase/CHASE3 domain sensor protein
LASLFSYLLGGSTLLGWTAVTWMAAHTATCFLMLGGSMITQAWGANKNMQEVHFGDVATVGFPPWAPLCTGIGAGSVLLSLIQSALSLEGPQHRDIFHLVAFLAAVILVLFFTVMVPMELEHKITTGLWMAFAVFVFTAYFSFRTLALDQESEAWVNHTSEVMAVTSDASSHLRKSLMGYRGYFWSGVTSELDQWQENIILTRRDFSQLRLLTSDNPRQQHVLDQVDVLFLQTVAGVEERIAFQKQRGTTAGLEEFRNSHASASMRSLDSLVLGMQEEERRLMRLRMVAQAENLTRTRLVVALGDSLAILFLMAAAGIVAMEFGARKRTERALNTARQKLTMAMAAGNMGTWELDLATDQSWRSIEHDRIFGYDVPVTDWGSKRFFAHVYPDDLESVKAAFAKAMRDGRLSCETRIRRVDHELRWIAIEGSVLFDEHHNGITMAGVLHDITASKELQYEIQRLNEDLEERVNQRTAELTDVNRELEAFTYSAAHDLRAPLRHMNSFVGFLHQDWYEKLDAEGRRYLDKIANSSRNMGILLDDLLNFSNIGRVEVRRNVVSLQQMVERIREELAPELRGRELIWEIGDLPDVSGDRTLLNQVMTNLIANAVKFTSKSDRARIAVGSHQESDQSVTVFVKDNGAGFEMKYADKLFGVFQRLHTSQDFEGTGIGLAIVRRIVERHGGRVWAEGAPGKGATFQFTLPTRGKTNGTSRLHSDGG